VTVRMRLHRELWDPTFYLESYVAKQAYYLRRLRSLAPEWLSLSCTEWNYQKDFKDTDVVGAVISVDALAVYAREGVTLSTKWSAPSKGSVLEYALLQLLANYDGKGGTIAGSSYVNVSSSSDMLGAHGFVSDSGQLHVLLLNRQVEAALEVAVGLPSATARSGSLYRLDAQNLQPGSPETLPAAGGKVVVTIPAVSAALLVMAAATPPPVPPPPTPQPRATCKACGYDCHPDCSNCGRCNTKPGCDSEAHCLGPCNSGGNAKWCGAPSPTPPAPPTPGSCPGDSLSTCIGLCPANPPAAYKACVQECATCCA